LRTRAAAQGLAVAHPNGEFSSLALRKRSFYAAQVKSRRESPVHKTPANVDALTTTRVGVIMRRISVTGIPIATRGSLSAATPTCARRLR
jgi:hypothetical protein